ncbi:MAG TPA: hypothetical protein VMS21_14035 [Methylomirabilota bacterium]|nr:hypothetical protein [Methylomirabilota bacterium]
MPGLGAGDATDGSFTDAGLINALTRQLLTTNQNFSARVEVVAGSDRDPQRSRVLMNLDARDGRYRVQIRSDGVSGGDFPPNASAALRALGLGESWILVSPHESRLRVVYPDLNVYWESPLEIERPQEGEAWETLPGEPPRELVDAELCERSRLVPRRPGADALEVIVWRSRARALFPIQVEFRDGRQAWRLRCRDLRLEAPPEARFSLPDGLEKVESIGDITRRARARLLGERRRQEPGPPPE